jgi:pimeloyl-ACP methyl ester carboxylesterase
VADQDPLNFSAGADAVSVISTSPVVLAAPERGAPLQLRLSAPANGAQLPIIIFSHGYTQSLHAYGPLVDFWAARGFVVIQPNHLDSRTLGLAQDDPRMARLWSSREQDLITILDNLAQVEELAPSIKGRLNLTRIAVAGHSWGATSASTLLGATHPDPDNGNTVNLADPRVKAGVLLCVAGTGGENLSPFAAANFAFMNPDFSQMRAPTLVVAGDADQSLLSVRGPDWWRQAYDLSPGPKGLFTVFGAEHSLGGIHSYGFDGGDVSPARVASIKHLSTAYLRNALYGDDTAWSQAVDAESAPGSAQGSVEVK